MHAEELILISVDDHVVEPPNVFEGRMPAKFADRAPRVVRTEEGMDRWLFEDEVVIYGGLDAVAGRPPEEYGLNPTAYEQMLPGCWDIHERVLDMSANGVLASMCFPSFPQFCGQLFSRQSDRELSMAVIRAYNDWHVDEWAGSYPGRIIPLAVLPLWDPTLMAAEVHRLAAKGCHAVCFSENPHKLGYPSLHDDSWDPFLAACDEEGTVICIHLGSSSTMVETSPDAPIDVAFVCTPVHLLHAAADLLWSQKFLKFKNLQVALSEGGIGWIPYFLERVDYVFEHHHRWTHAEFGGMKPSELFRKHMITCFIDDNVGLRNRDTIGIDRICWECDFPHRGLDVAAVPEKVIESVGGLTREEIDLITHRNAMRLFQFDPFRYIPRQDATAGALRATVPGRNLVYSDGRRPAENLRLTNLLG